jgi:pimeloyl-ACP methyl ester carboxylesterase
MDWSPVAEAADLVALLRQAAPGGAHLVGHSRGATSASWVAVEEPVLARSLALVASPPQASEAFRAHFRDLLPRVRTEREREALRYLAEIPEEDFPAFALRRWRGRALVVEAGRDPLYAPTQTLFWRAFLPYADFERVDDAGHDLPRERPEWLAERLLRFFADAEAP